MGKRRFVKGKGGGVDSGMKSRALSRGVRRKLENGVLHVEATFNNTKVLLADAAGNAVAWSSAGALGFSGAKKETPFAAAKVGELLGDKALQMGMKTAEVVIRGVGAGRESALRAFTAKGIELTRIADETPIPHGGCRPAKPRRI